MDKLNQGHDEIFIGTETFSGNSRINDDLAHEKMYRFKIVMNEAKKLIAIPEVYSEDSREWKIACLGWRLEDVTGSKGLFLDFGQKRFILPTEKVWDEINHALNNYEHKRP